MNKLVFSILLLLAQLPLRAQTEKGRFTIGAQIANLTYQNQNGGRTISASINPSIGYFVADGLVVGSGIPVSIANGKSTNDNSYNQFKSNSFAIGLAPFVRYYFGRNKFKPYLGVAYSYSKLTTNSSHNDQTGPYSYEGKGKATSFIPTIGLAYFVSPNLGLTIGLNYNWNHQDQTLNYSTSTGPSTVTGDSDTKSVSLGIGFQLFIGKWLPAFNPDRDHSRQLTVYSCAVIIESLAPYTMTFNIFSSDA